MKRFRDLLPKSTKAASSGDSRAETFLNEAGSAESGKSGDLFNIGTIFDDQPDSPAGKKEAFFPDLAKGTPPPATVPTMRRAAEPTYSSATSPSDYRERAVVQSSTPSASGAHTGLANEVGSLRNSMIRLEANLDGLRREVQGLEGRQRGTEKNIEDLLRRSELTFRQSSPYARSMGEHTSEGLPEQMTRSGPGETTNDWIKPPSRGERLNGEPEMYLQERHRRPDYPHGGWNDTMAPGPVYEPTHERALPQQEEHLPCRPETGQQRKAPILESLRNDYASVVLLMRWIEFLFERVKRDKLSTVLDYYQDIGWISQEVKAIVMSYARGEIQDVNAYEPELDDSMAPFALDGENNPILDDRGTTAHPHFRPLDDWKLSAEDHLKSMLFIKKMAGCRINKDELNALEQDIKVMKYSLRRYHEL